MSAPEDNLVCDLTIVMRMRLFCGLYSKRALAPRWRPFAQAYCVTFAILYFFYNFYIVASVNTISLIYWSTALIEHCVAIIVSLWTDDEYIYKFFTKTANDVTLDSRAIFNELQKQIRRVYLLVFVAYMPISIGLSLAAWFQEGWYMLVVLQMPQMLLEACLISVATTKLLIFALFKTRLLILRKRLQRYGFRTIGHRPNQPYCQIYSEIWQGLNTTNKPLKFLLFFDLIFACIRGIIFILAVIFYLIVLDHSGVRVLLIMYLLVLLMKIFVLTFGHVVLLEAATEQCENMAAFTATELIKIPTAEERQRMHDFLRLLETRARYYVLRAMPLDARLMLRVLGFISAQVVVFATLVILS